jgi:hypothetical protein
MTINADTWAQSNADDRHGVPNDSNPACQTNRSTKPIIHLSNDLAEVKDVVLLGRIFQRVHNIGEVRKRP